MVHKAVIPAAGLGTRFLPASKAVPNILFPVVDRPAIQYTVEEVVRAGIRNICIVISPGDSAVPEHFSPNPELEAALKSAGKSDLLEEVRRVTELADIDYVEQPEPLGLGHAVLMAKQYVGDDPFAVALPDEIYDSKENFLGELIASFDARGETVIAVTEVEAGELALYGSIDPENEAADLMKVRSIVEKPDPAAAPSKLAVIGRYVLHPDIFSAIEDLSPGAGGEIQLTDGLDVLAGKGRLYALRLRGRRWDTGKKDGYLEAVVTLAAEHEELGPGFRRFLSDFGS